MEEPEKVEKKQEIQEATHDGRPRTDSIPLGGSIDPLLDALWEEHPERRPK